MNGKNNNQKPYEFTATDITSNCNLRCQFCVNDSSNIGAFITP